MEIINILLTEFSWSVQKNLDLSSESQPHCVRSVLGGEGVGGEKSAAFFDDVAVRENGANYMSIRPLLSDVNQNFVFVDVFDIHKLFKIYLVRKFFTNRFLYMPRKINLVFESHVHLPRKQRVAPSFCVSFYYDLELIGEKKWTVIKLVNLE